MNAIVYTHLPEVIGLTILHSLWQVTLLWVLLVAVLRLWPQASSALRYVLALGTLVLCLVFAGATALYEWETLKPVQQTWQIDTGFAEAASYNGRAKANNYLDSTAANGGLCRAMARMVVAGGPGLYGCAFYG